MKTLWLIGVVLGVFAFTACGTGPPDISVTPLQHDFGQIEQGKVLTVEIPTLNEGKGNLMIEAVSTSCGCTSARAEPETIPPGSEGRLIIRYDSGAHPDRGPVRRYIYIASNDPDEAEVVVVITGNVQASPQGTDPHKTGQLEINHNEH